MLRTTKTALFKLTLVAIGTLISAGCGDDDEEKDDCSFGDSIVCQCPDGTPGTGLCGLDACECGSTADTGLPDGVSDTDTTGNPDTVTTDTTDTDGSTVDVPPGTETVCNDGLDDDGDGDIDCDDADCATSPLCRETVCDDDLDNDGDELVDCDDDDCDGLPACVESLCGDGDDNDGDGLTDCEDSDCSLELNCLYPPAWVAYTAQENSARMSLRIRSSDGLGPEYDLVPMDSQAIQGLAFSPDGRYLAYAYNGRANSGIRILNLETGDEETVTAGGNGLYRQPSWHPTDFAVVYSAGSEPNTASIYSYNMDTDTLGGPYASSDALGDPRFFVQGPAWNADASAIYVVAGVPGQVGVGDTRSDLAVLEGAGLNELRYLTTDLGASGRLTPNQDNTQFVFNLGVGGCQTFDPVTEATTPVPGAFSNIDCSYLSDDRFAAADGGNNASGDVRILTVEGRPLAQLSETPTLRELNTSASPLPLDAFTPFFVAE